MPFERFSEGAIRTIMLSQEEARLIGRKEVNSEMILLGLLGEGRGIASQALSSANLTLKELRATLRDRTEEISEVAEVEIPFTRDSKQLLELAWDVIRRVDGSTIRSEHLLLALIEQKGSGCKLLTSSGVDIESLTKQVFDLMNSETDSEEKPKRKWFWK